MPVRILPLNMKESQGKRMATRVIVIEVVVKNVESSDLSKKVGAGRKLGYENN